ncbi:MAG: hypothetical protein GY804_02470 [Alphaproteobacteria bacterium]|nr:hypothetical protein [Alphaproteobacteria bacterium]
MSTWEQVQADKELEAQRFAEHYDKNEDVWGAMCCLIDEDKIVDFFRYFIDDNELVKRFELDAENHFKLKQKYIDKMMEGE